MPSLRKNNRVTDSFPPLGAIILLIDRCHPCANPSDECFGGSRCLRVQVVFSEKKQKTLKKSKLCIPGVTVGQETCVCRRCLQILGSRRSPVEPPQPLKPPTKQLHHFPLQPRLGRQRVHSQRVQDS